MGSGVSVPARLEKEEAKALAGKLWDEQKWEAVAGPSGTITAVQWREAAEELLRTTDNAQLVAMEAVLTERYRAFVQKYPGPHERVSEATGAGFDCDMSNDGTYASAASASGCSSSDLSVHTAEESTPALPPQPSAAIELSDAAVGRPGSSSRYRVR